MVLQMYEKECGFYRDLAADERRRLARVASRARSIPRRHDFVLMLDDVGHHRQADQIDGHRASPTRRSRSARSPGSTRPGGSTPTCSRARTSGR